MRQSAATRLKLQNFDVQDEGASASFRVCKGELFSQKKVAKCLHFKSF